MDYYFYTKNLSVGYRGKVLINDIKIEISKGEILTLIGPNGAGKSTILKSIAKQLRTIAGTVYLDKKELGAMSGNELAKKMSAVFTEKLKTDLMTCEEVVATGRYPYTGYLGILTKEDKETVQESMELVHVTKLKDQDFSKISDGQRQRVMLARAICQEPEMIVLDEPTSFLDVKYKLEFLSMLQELRLKKKLSVLMSLHELELAERVSDKILCVKGDYVDRFGKPKEIFRSGYIRTLFGIERGTFDEANSSMELQAVTGKPEVFVIAGGGTGKPVYRELQREGIPFAAGILYENDLDYPVASALAAKLIKTEAFEPVNIRTLRDAKRCLDECRQIICCKERFGALEKFNEELLTYAKSLGKPVENRF